MFVLSNYHILMSFSQEIMIPRILNSQEIKSDFNSKMLNFSMGFTSY